MIPVCEPQLTEREIELVVDCLRSGWISSAGKYVDEFERRWADYCGMPHGVSVCNGTAGLQIAVELLDLQPGDEVILPTFTIISTALAVTRCGGTPVLIDSNPADWQMDVSQIEARITARTRAILAVHIYGHPAPMGPIMEIARRHGLVVIEDAAEAHGGECEGRKCGGLGNISVFSFYANKIITTGEGGMVLLRDERQATRARSLRNLCFEKSRRFQHHHLGHNFRFTNLQAAIGVAQLERIEQTIDGKRRIATEYHKRLQETTTLILPIEQPWAKHVYWVYGILLSLEIGSDAAEVSRRMRDRGIETRPFFLGMHEQPVFREMGLFKDERYPVAEQMSRRGLYLPNSLSLNGEQFDEICQQLKVSLGESR